MKKLFTIIFLGMACMGTGDLKAQVFEQGNGVLNLTLGLGNALYSGSGYRSSIPPVAVSYEVCLKDNVLDENGSIGVGGYLGYALYRWRYRYGTSEWGYNYSNLIIGPRGAFHYQLVENLDTYAGIMLGANIVSSKATGNVDNSYQASNGGLIYDAFIGARYYFNERIAGVGEFGLGVSYLNLGVAIKLK